MMIIAELDARELFEKQQQSPDLQLVDVREPEEFAEIHIAGSVNLPLSRLEHDYSRIIGNRTAYLICSSGVRAERAAVRLAQHQVNDTCVLKGGLSSWSGSRLPLEGSLHQGISIERQVRIASGSLVLLGICLAYSVYPIWIWLSVIVSLGMILSGITNSCALGEILEKAPWNLPKSNPVNNLKTS